MLKNLGRQECLVISRASNSPTPYVFSKDSLTVVMRHILSFRSLKKNPTKTLYQLFSKTGMLIGAAAIELHSQMQAGMGGDQVETFNY